MSVRGWWIVVPEYQAFLMPMSRQVYFAFLFNWYAKEADDPLTVKRFYAAINEALTRGRSALS